MEDKKNYTPEERKKIIRASLISNYTAAIATFFVLVIAIIIDINISNSSSLSKKFSGWFVMFSILSLIFTSISGSRKHDSIIASLNELSVFTETEKKRELKRRSNNTVIAFFLLTLFLTVIGLVCNK